MATDSYLVNSVYYPSIDGDVTIDKQFTKSDTLTDTLQIKIDINRSE